MKTKILILSLAVMAFVSCGSSKAVVAPTPTDDVEVVVPCSGIEYMTSAEYFRANAMGVSNSLEIAGQKAMSAARSKLAAAIETTVKTVTDNYISSYEENDKEEARGRFQSLSREVVNQKLNGVRVICQKTMKSPDGQYKSYVAIELSGSDIVNAMKSRISDDSKLRTDFEYKKFEETFNKEMAELAAN